MGYALMSARKIALTSKINKLNFQIMCLSQGMESVSNTSNNLQRMMGASQNWNSIMQSYGMLSQVSAMNANYGGYAMGCGGSNGCMGGMGNMGGLFGNGMNSPVIGDDFMQYFWPLAQASMIENDLETQKKQLETQLQVATKELEAVEKAEEQAIGRATPKYA